MVNFTQKNLTIRKKSFKSFVSTLGILLTLLLSNAAFSQSNHTVTFTGNSTDFNTAEKYTAGGNSTDYYVTFDAAYLYIGAFRTGGQVFGSADNLAIYIDSDPFVTPTAGTGTTTGQTYNGVSGTLPFSANYNVHAEQGYQEARSFGSSWASTISGVTYTTSTTAREVKIPLTSIGSPNNLYLTMWMGYASGFFSNAPGTNLGSSASPTITGYFGNIALKSGVTAVSAINTPIAPIYLNNFTTGSNTTVDNETPSVLDSNLTNGGWINGTGSTSFIQANGSGSVASSLAVSTLSNSPFKLTLTVASGYTLSLNSYSYWRQASQTGTNVTSIVVNGVTITSGSVSAPTSGTNIGQTAVANAVSGLTGTVTVTINFSGTSGSFRLDDFALYGVVAQGASLSTNGTASLTYSTSQSVGSSSASQTFNLSGSSLTGAPGNITVSAPNTDFQVSSDNSTWGSTATIAYSSATLSSTPVYVRFTPQSVGAKSGNVTFSGGGVTTPPTIAVTGTGAAAPSITSFSAASPGSGTSGYVGNTITITGTGFTGVTVMKIGGSTGTTVSTFTVVSDTSITFPAIGASGTIYLQNGAGNTTSASSYTDNGYITTASGTWQTAATWLGGAVPPSASTTNVTIANNVTGTTGTIAVGKLTVNSSFTLTNTASATINVNTASTNSGTITNNGTIGVGATYTNSGTFTIGNGATFQINQGGYLTGTNLSYNATASILSFNNTTGQYGVVNTHAYWPSTNGPITVNVLGAGGVQIQTGTTRTVSTLNISGGLDIQAANLLTVSGTLTINTGGGITSNPPVYGGSSTLVYNTTSNPYAVNQEWTGNSTTAGAGVPQNVTIQSSNNVTMPASSRGIPGNIQINGTSTLSLNGTSGNDLYIGGNWTRATGTTFTPNGRAVMFNGSATQTITSSGGTETFNYLFSQGSGTIKLATGTNVVVSSSNGLNLGSSNATSTVDLNGQTLTVSGGGTIDLGAGARKITSSATGGLFKITTSLATVTNGGSLSFAATNVTVELLNGLDFGSGLTTINGTLQIDNGGYVQNNAPIYGAASTLLYNGVTTYGVFTEWTSNATTAGAGTPQNVSLTSSSITMPTTARSLAGNLIIGSGSTMVLSSTSGGDLNIGGNWTNSGTFTHNSRAVQFRGTASQTITGATNFAYLTINNSAGIVLANAVNVSNQLDLTSGKITLGTNNLTIASGATVINASSSSYVITSSTGQLLRTVASSNVAYPVGNSSYNPITFNNSGTSDVYGVRVVDGAITTGANNTKTVSRSWVTTESVSGGSNLSVVAQYNTGEPNTGYAAGTNSFIGFYNGTSWTQVAATVSGSNPFTATSSSNISPSNLTSGTQYFAIGKDNAFTSVGTNLVISSISPNPPTAGSAFSVTVQCQDAYGAVSNVTSSTAFTLTTNGNAGVVGGTYTGSIFAGTSSFTVTGFTLSASGTAATLTATRTSGDVLSPGTSSTFDVLDAATHLAFVGVPSTGTTGINLASFTVEARRPDNSVDNTYVGTITLSVASGPGSLAGTISATAVAGVATFSAAQLDTAGAYTLTASSGSLTTDTTGTITIALAPVVLAGWDFFAVTSGSPPSTFAATTFNSNLVSTSGASNITRGSGAAASGANSSFRTVGFQNNGIATSNTDYFQTTLSTATGYAINLSTITANYNGTTSFYNSPGVTSQYAYSLDGTNFTLIGSPVTTTSLVGNVDLTGVTALQGVPSGTTIYIRYYASGQSTTGGWGFYSSVSGSNGLAYSGNVVCITPTAYSVTGGGTFCTGGSGVAVGLSGSQAGMNYQLKLNGSNVGSPVAGTGTAISFGNKTAAGTYTVVASNTNGTCNLTQTMTGSATVTVDATSVAGTPSSAQAICSGTSPSDITVTGYTGSIQWQSSTNNISFSNIVGETTDTLAGTTIGDLTTATYFRVLVTNGTCSSTNSTSVAVTMKTNVSILSATASASPICNSGTTTLNANSVAGTNATVTWYTGSGGTGTSLGTGSVLSGVGPGTYYAYVTGDCGSPAEASVTVAAKTDVSISSATAASSPICLSSTTTLTAHDVAGTNAYTSWWSAPGGSGTNYGNGTTLTGAYPGTYYVRVTGDCGTPAETSITIDALDNAGIASATAAISPICSTATTTLTANGVVGENASVTWYSGAGGTGSVLGTGTTLSGVGAGTYYARVTADCGSPSEASVTVVNYSNVGITSIIPDAAAVCSGGTTSLTANGVVGDDAVVDWFTGSGATGTHLGTGTVLSDVGVGTYYAYVTGDCGTPAQASITITTKTNIGITSATAASSSICSYDTTTLSANGVVGTGAVVTWYTGPGATGTNLGTGIIISAGPGTYYARVTGDCGTATEQSVVVGTKSVASITSVSAAAASVCSDGTTDLTANGVSGSGANVEWFTLSGGDGTYLGSGTTLNNVGPGTYYAYVSADCGSPAEASVTVGTKTDVGITSASAASSALCTGGTTTLTANGVTGTGATVNWYTATGGTGTHLGSGATLSNAGPGTYYAYVTGDCGSPAEASVTVAEKTNVGIVSVTSDVPAVCNGETTSITANGVTGTNAIVTWYTGSGATGSYLGVGSSANVVSGTYYAYVTGDCGSPAEASVVVGENASAAITSVTAPDSAVCSGDTITITANGVAGANAVVTWYTGVDASGDNLGTGATMDVVAGTYYAYVTADCGSPAQASITIGTKTSVYIDSISSADTDVCSGEIATLNATGVAGTNAVVTWYTGSGATGDNLGTGLTMDVVPGTYYAYVTGDCGSPAEATITIGTKTIATITSVTAPDSAVCSGDTITVSANGVGGTNAVVTWYTGVDATGDNLGTGTTMDVVAGTYYAYVVADCGPAVQSSITIGTKDNVSISSISSSSSSVCSGDTVTLSAEGVSGTNALVTWYTGTGATGDNLGSSASMDVTPGTYYAYVTGDCGAPAEASITINETTSVSLTSVTAAVNPICANASTTVTANGVGGSNAVVSWYNGTDATGTYLGNGLTMDLNPGTYFVSVTGDCGAPATASITIDAISDAVGGTVSSDQTICPGRTPASISVADNTGSVQKWQKDTDSSFSSPTDINVTTTTLTGATIGALSTTTYFRAVIDNGGCSTAYSSYATINMGGTSTWSGSAWDNTPVGTSSLVFEGNFTSTGDVTACSCTVNSGAVVMSSSDDMFLSGPLTVNGGSMTFSNNSYLLQSDDTVTNSGNIIMKRDTNALKRLDYIMWSSPVANQILLNFSPMTQLVRFYNYDTSTSLYTIEPTPSTTTFGLGNGYLIRMPNNHPSTPTVWHGQFTGTPHNGTVNVSMSTAGQGFNLIGNPYPSTLDMAQFTADNAANITGTLYFWRKTNQAVENAYSTWTDHTFVSNSEGVDPNDVMQMGQGFIVQATGSSVQFNNGQRVANHGNQMFKGINNLVAPSVSRNRFWLNMTSTNNEFTQMAVGYNSNASQDVDPTDGKQLNDGSITLSSYLNSNPYIIQGRALPFDSNDIVPLVYSVTNAGTYTIAIDHVDGFFAGNGQEIFIKDNLYGTITSLTAGSFTFVTDAGTYNDRFQVVYQSAALAVGHNTLNSNNVIIYKQNGNVVINTGNIIMDNVKIFDIRGRLLMEKSHINQSETRMDAGDVNQVLIVKVTSVDNEVVNKKVIN